MARYMANSADSDFHVCQLCHQFVDAMANIEISYIMYKIIYTLYRVDPTTSPYTENQDFLYISELVYGFRLFIHSALYRSFIIIYVK